jgi:hypothetical protein
MAKRKDGRFKKMLGLGFISFEKALIIFKLEFFSTYHSAKLQTLDWSPKVSNGFVPEHAFVPNLNEKAGLQIINFTAKIV